MNESDTTITCDRVSKRYLIDEKTTEATLFRKMANALALRPASYGYKPEEFWALRDVSFHAKKGEVIGVIGTNGSGKSTLLRIVSGVELPTSGCVAVDGKIVLLPDVNGGLSYGVSGRAHIERCCKELEVSNAKQKFDEIVCFAGVERFVDIPTQFYSTGMKVRLAFSIMAHLPFDVLAIDDVLSVCDAEFQRKCIHKIENLAKDGGTVLFASNNMQHVERLCRVCVVLRAGRIAFIGPTSRAINDTRGLV